MYADRSLIEKVFSNVSRDETVKVASDLINIPSPAGHERRLGEYIADYLGACGLETLKQVLSEDRINAIGFLRGAGGGYSLSFNGHIDTSFTGTKEDLLFMRREDAESPENQPKAYVKDGYIYGLGIGNMKAGLTALLLAAKALKVSMVRLKGDAVFAAVVGETARAPVDDYWGPEYEGGGYGSRYLVARGLVSDYALCCDGSNMRLSWAQAGVAFLKITTFGNSAYVPFVQRDWNGRQSISALAKMVPIINAVEDWAASYEKEYKRFYDGLEVAPKVCIGCVRAGAPYRPSVTPGVCSIYVDVRTPPDVTPLEIKRKIEDVVSKTGIPADIKLYRSQMGHVAKGAEELIKAVSEAYQYVMGKPVEKATAPWNSMWTDMNVYNEIGIPSVKIGPSPQTFARERAYGAMPIDDIMNAAKVYALTAIDICNRERK